MMKRGTSCRHCGGESRGPPAFLTKTLEILNDPSTNSVVSWNLEGTRLIIRDHLSFTERILPKYFKHRNYSSFIYQLNKYGFRRIGHKHEWVEYENPLFQAGKEHLLASIKSRDQNSKTTAQKGRKRSCPDHELKCNDVEMKVLETLEDDVAKAKLEMQRMKTQQDDTERFITALEAQLKMLEEEPKKKVGFAFAQACTGLSATREEASDCQTYKKPKLVEPRNLIDGKFNADPYVESGSEQQENWGGILMSCDQLLCEDEEDEFGSETASKLVKFAQELEAVL